MSGRIREWHVRWVCIVSTAVYSFWLTSIRTWNPDYNPPLMKGGYNFWGSNFFRWQAESMLHGRLEVPSVEFGRVECYTARGKCFGYFGLFPSIARIAASPLAWGLNRNLMPVMFMVATAVTMWAVLDLAGRSFPESGSHGLSEGRRLVALGATGALLGPGSVLAVLSQPKVYQEAIIWSIAWMMVALAMLVRWTSQRRLGQLGAMLLAGTAAANSRPSAGPATVVLGGAVALVIWSTRKERAGHRTSEWLLGASVAIVPMLTMTAVFWAKFHRLQPSFDQYGNQSMLRGLRQVNGGRLFGFRFVPTALAQYLRPDSLTFVGRFPWVRFAVPYRRRPIVLPPLHRNGLIVDNTASLTNLMPLAVALTLLALVSALVAWRRSRRLVPPLPVSLLAVAAAVPVTTLMNWLVVNRYNGDFYPLVAVGVVVAIGAVVRRCAERPRLVTGFLALCVVAAAWSTFVMYLLHYQSWMRVA